MSDIPVQLVVAAFNNEQAAQEAYEVLQQARKEKLLGIKEAAVVSRDTNYKLHIKDYEDMGGGKGAVIGGLFGAVLGLLAGPVLLAGTIGALVGGLAAKLYDGGLPDERLEQLGDALKPGTSAIVAVIEYKWIDDVQSLLLRTGADVLTEEISSDIAAQLEAGKDVAVTALQTQKGMRFDGEKESVEISGLAITQDGLVAGKDVA